MKTIDLDKAAAFRQQWEQSRINWQHEADRLEAALKTGPAKYYQTRKRNLADAKREVAHFAELIADLDRTVSAARLAGKAVTCQP